MGDDAIKLSLLSNQHSESVVDFYGSTRCGSYVPINNRSRNFAMSPPVSSRGLFPMVNHAYLCLNVGTRSIRHQIINFGPSNANVPNDGAISQNSSIAINIEVDEAHPSPHAGNCHCECRHFGGLFWYNERLKRRQYSRHPEYHLCYGGGKFYMNPMPYPPPFIQQLLGNSHFMGNIRAYNQMFAMMSFGAKVDESPRFYPELILKPRNGRGGGRKSRLDFILKRQKDLRSNYLSGLYDTISKGDHWGIMVGLIILLPSTFTGGPRVFQQKVKDFVKFLKEVKTFGRVAAGKTFMWKTIISSLRSQGKIVLAVASSGITSLLLPSDRTAHSRFKLPLELTDESLSHVKKNTQLEKLLVETNLIIWDEAPMNDRRCFETLDKTLRYLMSSPNLIFGGKTVVLGGDFRQTLPVKKGMPELIDFIYDQTTLKTPTGEALQEKAIMCPKNDIVDAVNAKILSLIEGRGKTYLSKDEAIPMGKETSETKLLYPMEYLNTINFPGFSPYELHLKVGSPIMLLRNVNLSAGLCNGKQSEFPEHYFEFVAYNQLSSRVPYHDENSKTIYPMLIDYLGCIRSISDIMPFRDANKGQGWLRNVDIENLDGNVVEFTMWDDLAKQFNKEEIEKLSRPIIIVVSSCRVSKYRDYRLASLINRAATEVNDTIMVRDQFLEELHSLGIRHVPSKMAEFLREIQMRDKETVAKLQVFVAKMELNACNKSEFI
uniref:ATP-dependent DNA helicase n=1 Tax=Tanacetum cinerariifolium TaxID=118510 RepID=A0A6L2JPK3_TANCI|nr:ATP-dependent DNA helicase PIF1-like [Tanacetum cinerariifolium]